MSASAMRITGLAAKLVRLPVGKAIGLPMAGAAAPSRAEVEILRSEVATDAGLTGVGIVQVPAAGRSLAALTSGELSSLLIGEDAARHERLWAKVRSIDDPAIHRAYAAVDAALWDLKGKAAGQPLWKLLGGARESAKAFSGEPAGCGSSTDAVIAAARAAIAQGIAGVRVAIRGVNPEAESHALVAIREAIGDDVWFAVTVENPFDYETALPMARFLDEEIGVDWFEDPLADDDLVGYERLASRVETPLAAGGRFTTAGQFLRLLKTGAPITLRPDLLRLGGVTPLLKVAALAELHRRPLVPRMPTELAVHLACGLPGVNAVEFGSWLTPLLTDPPRIDDGKLAPPTGAGWGLEFSSEMVDRFAV